MAWVLFEILLAFGIAIFIVWWTFPKQKKAKRPVDAKTPPAPPPEE